MSCKDERKGSIKAVSDLHNILKWMMGFLLA
jgi:hypothetical protein